MAKNSDRLLDYYNKHLREANDAYIKEQGDNLHTSEIISTLPEKTLTLFPGLGLTPVAGSLLAISVPV